MWLRVFTVLVVTACVVVQSSTGQQLKGPGLGFLASTAAVDAASTNLQKRNTNKDNAALATGFAGHHHHGHHHHAGHHLAGAGAGGLGHGHHGHGKFFMYAHQPEHKHYEFGFKRGNDKHVVERYEKGGPHHNFKSKFRWHDKHGGHGERYWDYNHGDHHGDGGSGGGGGGGDDGHHGYHSEPIPEFIQPGSAKDAYRHRRKSSDKKTDITKKPTGMEKKSFFAPKEQQLYKSFSLEDTKVAQQQPGINDMLGFDPFSPPDIMKSHSSVGGITASYPVRATTLPPPIAKPFFTRNSNLKKNNPKKYKTSESSISSEEVPKLAFDLDSGRVYDEKTGKWFRLVAD